MKRNSISSYLNQKDISANNTIRPRGRMETVSVSENNMGVAAVLSLIVPGAGQMYRGNVNSGLKWFMLVPLGYFLFILPGLFMHIACVYRAGHEDLYNNQN